MKTRYPLYLKVLLWLLLNILLIAGMLVFILNTKYQTEIESFLGGKSSARLREIAQVVSRELNSQPNSEWNAILKNFSQIYNLKLYLFRCNGTQIAGEKQDLPQDVLSKLASLRGAGGAMRGRGGPPPGRGYFRMLQTELDEPRYFFIHSSYDSTYWAGIRLNLEQDSMIGGGIALVARIDSLFNNTLFDFNLIFFAAGAAILFSIIFWLPFVGNITKSLKEITRATEKIANGNFDNRVKENRNDELGVLAKSINKLAEQLQKYINGQKRFLGDTAHELNSPLARIEIALGIIEQRADPALKDNIQDIREETNLMSALIKELLFFSKVGLQETKIELRKLKLKPIVLNVISREANQNVEINLNIPDELIIIANEEFIERAMANLIRNSIRYAAQAGAIEINATELNSEIVITVADQGPGVPEEELDKIFKPFYRIEQSRSRDYGGAGLGLAITKACIEACRGSIRAMNRKPRGLIVEIKLPRTT
ncbi:MAG: sensor histidine kinase [Limisphaerales bacterium]